MRTVRRLAVGVALAACAVAGTAAGAAAAGGQLSGTWTSTDNDGSSQTLRITGSGLETYAMSLYDASASVCGGAPAGVVGTGQRDGDTVTFDGALQCRPGGNFLRGRLTLGFEYSAADDTLTDDTGVVWTR